MFKFFKPEEKQEVTLEKFSDALLDKTMNESTIKVLSDNIEKFEKQEILDDFLIKNTCENLTGLAKELHRRSEKKVFKDPKVEVNVLMYLITQRKSDDVGKHACTALCELINYPYFNKDLITKEIVEALIELFKAIPDNENTKYGIVRILIEFYKSPNYRPLALEAVSPEAIYENCTSHLDVIASLVHTLAEAEVQEQLGIIVIGSINLLNGLIGGTLAYNEEFPTKEDWISLIFDALRMVAESDDAIQQMIENGIIDIIDSNLTNECIGKRKNISMFLTNFFKKVNSENLPDYDGSKLLDYILKSLANLLNQNSDSSKIERPEVVISLLRLLTQLASSFDCIETIYTQMISTQILQRIMESSSVFQTEVIGILNIVLDANPSIEFPDPLYGLTADLLEIGVDDENFIHVITFFYKLSEIRSSQSRIEEVGEMLSGVTDVIEEAAGSANPEIAEKARFIMEKLNLGNDD